MAAKLLFICFVLCVSCVKCSSILCTDGFCREFRNRPGCAPTAAECSINNATHTGMWLPSLTPCNCCPFCLPFFGRDDHCSLGGPGLGTTVGRCGHGLTCHRSTMQCARMTSQCHTAQDDFDRRHVNGQTGVLEQRPYCDGKGRYAAFDCVPGHTCFCQSEQGERIFGEVRHVSATQNMPCGCARLHNKIMRTLSPGVPYPVTGPRCTEDGNFSPVQCMNRTCHCVNRITGTITLNGISINLDQRPITELPCYDKNLDLYPEQSRGKPPYNFTTPCLEEVADRVELIARSAEEGFNVDYFTSVTGCSPDGSYGRVIEAINATRICVDHIGQRIGNYTARRDSSEYREMDCKCAVTSQFIASLKERPVCCRNGNFRRIQCRRGMCRCVDSNGKQVGTENTDVTRLPCYTHNWQNC